MTVSRSINQENIVRPATREKVMRAIADLGFVPMKPLAIWLAAGNAG
jgi:DNA-binding LacI/PurR family transcriptional regulator